jgi:hypothetical protein
MNEQTRASVEKLATVLLSTSFSKKSQPKQDLRKSNQSAAIQQSLERIKQNSSKIS